MIVSIMSKRGGTGCTTFAITAAITAAKKFNRKTILVDLKNKNDVARLLSLKTNSSIDMLISELGIDDPHVDVNDAIYNYNGLDVIPGTIVSMPMFLYKRSSRIKDVLEFLDTIYDLVILDIDDDLLYKDLISIGLKVWPVNILEQNMLVVLEYQYDMKKGLIDGLIVVNKLDNSIYPTKTEFDKNFNKDRLFYVPSSSKVKHFMNRMVLGKLELDKLSKTEYFQGVFNVCASIDKRLEKIKNSRLETESDDFGPITRKPSKQNKSKKSKGFFPLFGKKKGGDK